MQTVFITKYWQTMGIQSVEVIKHTPPGVLVRFPDKASFYVGGSHWYDSKIKAESKVSKLAEMEVKKLEKKITYLKTLIK